MGVSNLILKVAEASKTKVFENHQEENLQSVRENGNKIKESTEFGLKEMKPLDVEVIKNHTIQQIVEENKGKFLNVQEALAEEENNRKNDLSKDGNIEEIHEANETKVDDYGNIYVRNGKLEPITIYELNGNIYTTDEQGRIVNCEAHPKRSPENPRDVNAQLQAGGEDRRPSDQGGHIVGRDLNGDGGVGNLIAMDAKINQSDYKRMENDIKASIDEGKGVSVTTEIRYSDESKRPDTFEVTVIADEVKSVYKFDNNLEGELKNEIPENGKQAVIEEINDTKGEISSIKEEYDKNGKLSETIVNITYADENGVNRRTKVYISAE